MTRSRWNAAAALALACAVAGGPSAAAASTRNYLTVQGLVLDHTKSPLAGAWVFCTGSRRASAPTDSSGAYMLQIPGATLEELNHAPLKIRISARKKGWRFALDNGAPELGLEMRVVQEDGKLPRLLIRSNDQEAVSAVANSAVLDANPRALVGATFIGSQGAQYDTPPVPLDIGDEVTLAGSVGSVPEMPGTPKGPPEIETEPDSTPPASAAPHASPAPSASSAPVSVAPAPAAAAAPQTSVAPSVPTVQTTPPPSSSSKKKKKGSAGKPKVYHPGDAPQVPMTPAPQAYAVTPQGASPAPPASAPSAQPAPHASDPSLKPVLQRDAPVSGVSPATPPPASKVGVAPPGAAQPVPSRGPAAPPASTPPSASATTCDCTIRGTVEVNSDRPLTGRTEVVISIDDAPQTTASVELFMGSPRGFEIHPAPCGVHRLLLWTRSKQRFVLVSSEPRVVCTEGGTQQMRLVLEPVARWGAGR